MSDESFEPLAEWEGGGRGLLLNTGSYFEQGVWQPKNHDVRFE